MMKKFVILFIFFPLFVFAQTKPNLEQKLEKDAEKDELNYDTNYISSHRERLTIKAYISSKSDQVTQQGGTFREKVVYDVNRPNFFGLGISYKWFNFSATLFPVTRNSEIKQKGLTTHFDLRLTSNGRTMLIDVWLQNFNGFYLSNTINVIPKWNKPGIFYQRSDIATADFGGVLYYNVKHKKFSFKALFSQNERQIKSTGTPIIGTNFSIFQMTCNADSSLLPYTIAKHFKASEQIHKINVNSLGLGAGYAYTFVFAKYWFLSLQGTYFINSQNYTYASKVNPKGTVYVGLKGNFLWRGSLGYNSEDNYYGLIFMGNSVPLSRDKFPSDIDYIFTTVNLMYAHRFDIPKRKKK